MTKKPPQKTDSQSDPVTRFEKSLTELEALVEKLEDGEMSLEDSLQAFERGVALTKDCQTALRNAELRVQQLVGDEDGELAPLDDDADGSV